MRNAVRKVKGKQMGDAPANPIYVALLCTARCLVPLVILFGVSYLLRRFGVIAKPAPPPEEFNKTDGNGY